MQQLIQKRFFFNIWKILQMIQPKKELNLNIYEDNTQDFVKMLFVLLV